MVVSVVVGSIDHVGLVGLWVLVGVVLARHGSCGRAGVLRSASWAHARLADESS